MAEKCLKVTTDQPPHTTNFCTLSIYQMMEAQYNLALKCSLLSSLQLVACHILLLQMIVGDWWCLSALLNLSVLFPLPIDKINSLIIKSTSVHPSPQLDPWCWWEAPRTIPAWGTAQWWQAAARTVLPPVWKVRIMISIICFNFVSNEVHKTYKITEFYIFS